LAFLCSNAHAYENHIAAVVENRIITFDQLYHDWQAFASHASFGRPSNNQVELSLLRSHLGKMIDRILIVKEFERKKGKIPESFVEGHYQQHLRDHFHNERQSFSEYLHQNGKSVHEFKEEIRQQAIVHFLSQDQTKVIISPEEIRLYYEQHRGDFFQKSQIYLQQALVPCPSTVDREKLRKTLEQVSSAWAPGTGLEEKISLWQKEIPDIRYQDLGWISSDDLRQELQKAAQGLAKGEHTPWLDISNALALLYLSAQRQEYCSTLPEVYGHIQEILCEQRQQENYNAWVQRLQQKAFIRYYL
jgi:hypothetical protein